jgi:hypothetical protein
MIILILPHSESRGQVCIATQPPCESLPSKLSYFCRQTANRYKSPKFKETEILKKEFSSSRSMTLHVPFVSLSSAACQVVEHKARMHRTDIFHSLTDKTKQYYDMTYR